METTETQETTQEQVAETPALSTLNLYADAPTTENVVEDTKVEEQEVEDKKVEEKAPETKVEPEKVETVKEIEKIVEKVVEKQPEFKDEKTKELYEAFINGKTDDIRNYLNEISTDYNTMSDVDVVKRKMKLENPTWSDKYVDVEFKSKYGSALASPKDLSEIDKEDYPEKYEEAQKYNEEIEIKEVLLDQAARDARLALEAKKQTIEFPKVKVEEKHEEQPLSQDEIDELNRKWESRVETDLQQLSEFKFKVGDEEVVYKITDEDKASQTAYMKDYDGLKMAQELGWVDAEGNENPLKIAEDLLKLKNLDKIIASTATQMKTNATKEVISEIKNLDLTKEQSSAEPTNVEVGKLIWGQ